MLISPVEDIVYSTKIERSKANSQGAACWDGQKCTCKRKHKFLTEAQSLTVWLYCFFNKKVWYNFFTFM